MSYKKYMLVRLLFIVIMAVVGAWAVTSDNLLLLIPVVVVWAAVVFTLKRRVTEVVVDERVNTIAGKASRLAFVAFVMLAVVTGAVLVYLDRDAPGSLFNIGLTLNFAACALILFYWAAYIYYNRKLGGK